ncbi:putative immunity protein, partial [Desertihabitans aurantiacus]|uniref:putative immunity protein n=1 Tax=Desertihabitans aurantiacus TaxID=2282477 RepID=UPI0038B78EBF
MPSVPEEVPLAVEELRVVARFAAAAAEEVLPVFERQHPDDGRPRAALEAARVFVEGAPRSRLQRAASVEAHRAAREAATEAARLAAQAAGDASAAAYLHPLAR